MKTHYIAVFLILFPVIVFSQNTFQKVFRTAEWDYSLCLTVDSGFVIAGTAQSPTGFDKDICIIKTDNYGNIIWDKIIGGSNNDEAFDISLTNDNGFIVIGSTSDVVAGNYNYVLLKIDSNGSIMWTKTYGYASINRFLSIKQIWDGGYIFSSNTFLCRTNSLGNKLWNKGYLHAGESSTISNVVVTEDSGFVVSGEIIPLQQPYITKIDSLGTVQWAITYSDTSQIFANYVNTTSDNGYIIGGTSRDSSLLYHYGLIIKTNATGNIIWSKIYSDFVFISKINQVADGYIVLGSNSFSSGMDLSLMKVDSLGNVLWARRYGASGQENPGNVEQTLDGGYILAGGRSVVSHKLYLVKTDSIGHSGCLETTPIISTIGINPSAAPVSSLEYFLLPIIDSVLFNSSTGIDDSTICISTQITERNTASLKVFPNPSAGRLVIESTGEDEIERVEIWNIMGEHIYSEVPKLSKEITIFLTDLSNGMYIIKVFSKKEILTAKVLLKKD